MVEELLIDLHAFYKNSSKRQNGLVNTAKETLERCNEEKRKSIQREVTKLTNEMDQSIENGNEFLEATLTHKGKLN